MNPEENPLYQLSERFRTMSLHSELHGLQVEFRALARGCMAPGLKLRADWTSRHLDPAGSWQVCGGDTYRRERFALLARRAANLLVEVDMSALPAPAVRTDPDLLRRWMTHLRFSQPARFKRGPAKLVAPPGVPKSVVITATIHDVAEVSELAVAGLLDRLKQDEEQPLDEEQENGAEPRDEE